ncbi:MAG: hypothetical protein H0T72_04990, partial [Chloroflexia bacterium]|nr:hypothetical protein [Chloroflexia bacterium]
MQRLGRILLHRGDAAGAETLIAEALRVATITNAEWTLPSNLEALGACALARGDGRRAAALLAECLTMIRDGWGIFGPVRSYSFFWFTAAGCLESLGMIAAGIGEDEPAGRLCGAADALRERRGERSSALQEARLERAISPMRNGRGGVAFTTAWAAGRALSPEAACDEGRAFAAGVIAAAPRRRTKFG